MIAYEQDRHSVSEIGQIPIDWITAKVRAELSTQKNKNVAREETEMSAWPRQPRIRQEIPPGYALIWLQAGCACNQS